MTWLFALSIVSHVHFFVFGKGIAVLAAGGYVAGDRAARSVLRGRLRKLAHGGVDLSRLPAEADGGFPLIPASPCTTRAPPSPRASAASRASSRARSATRLTIIAMLRRKERTGRAGPSARTPR